MNKEIAFENLAAITSLLDERGIRAWLDGGSLLGCYRGGDLIDHDEDTDLGLHLADWRREPALDFLQAMKAAGFTLECYFGDVLQGLEICLERRGVTTDLFFYYPEGERVWCGGWANVAYPGRPELSNRRRLIKYYYERFELRSLRVKGAEFYVPADTERFLTTLYGETWRIPDPTWGGMTSPPNAVVTSFEVARDPTTFVEQDFLERALPSDARDRRSVLEAVEAARARRRAARAAAKKVDE